LVNLRGKYINNDQVNEAEMGMSCRMHGGNDSIIQHRVSRWERYEEKTNKEDIEMCGRITLKLSLEEYDRVVLTALIWLRIGNNHRFL
jgi:hypothetical protein